MNAQHPPGRETSRYALALEEIARLMRLPGCSRIAVVVIGIAGIGDINRRHGYAAGDAAIRALLSRVETLLRPQDALLQLGSTSFALLVVNPMHDAHAVLAAERVAALAADPIAVGSARVRLRVHTGVSLWPGRAATEVELLAQCEEMLGEARRRDLTHLLYEPATGRGTDGGQPAWYDLGAALEAGQVELFVQPQVELATGRQVAAEALVRWRHPEKGLLSPVAFVTAEEDLGSMRALLGFVLNAGLRHAARWQASHPGFRICVNLAASNLDDDDLVAMVEDALHMWQVDPGCLVLELTEGSFMRDPAAAIRTMQALRAIGSHTSIDDFGTGYSSLAYLRELPADELKIDRSFIRDVSRNPRDRDILRSIVQLAHAVGLRTVAEGIEDAATASAIAATACDLGQGYLWSPPVPVVEFERSLLASPAADRTDAAPGALSAETG